MLVDAQGRTAGGRTDEDYFTTLMQGSEYSKRLPIGKVDVIRNCSPETVRCEKLCPRLNSTEVMYARIHG